MGKIMDDLTKDEKQLMTEHEKQCDSCRFTLCEVYGSRTNIRWIRCDGCGERMRAPIRDESS
jgi:hypothetical protein